MWNTLDIGIQFDKATNIRSQLDKVANGGDPKPPTRPTDSADAVRKSSLAREPFSPSDVGKPTGAPSTTPSTLYDDHARFDALKSFYKDQISRSESNEPNILSASSLDLPNYSSPSSLTRIMSIYTNLGTAPSHRKSKQKPQPMREAISPAEGLSIPSREVHLKTVNDHLTTNQASDAFTTTSQRTFQHAPALGNPNARKVSALRPLPTLLCTKRAKRCLACKHILTKPEIKPTSTRYRIRLLALNYIPLVSLKPVPVSVGSSSGPSTLEPGRPSQWVLTMHNPLFERVSVSLGCPATLPGTRGDRVTILCPQFEIGANSDVWDDALNTGTGGGGATLAKTISGEQVAGKVYESGRNWVGLVLEIVPGLVFAKGLKSPKKKGSNVEAYLEGGLVDEENVANEGEDVVEIPIRVRLEWRVGDDVADGKDKKKPKTVSASRKLISEEEGGSVGDLVEDGGRRELAYWMVLGVGRVQASSL